MVNQFAMPSSLAANQDEFRALFYNVPHNDWIKCKGFGFAHLLAYELDELILSTPGMSSPDIDDAKIEFAQVIAHYIKDDVATLPSKGVEGFVYHLHIDGVDGEKIVLKKVWNGTEFVDFKGTLTDLSYEMIHKIYVPTPEEYEYLASKEYGVDSEGAPIVWGVYDSIKVGARPYPKNPPVSKLDNAHFNFCLKKWNEFHDSNLTVDEFDKETDKVLKRFKKTIEVEWSKLSPVQQLEWVRG